MESDPHRISSTILDDLCSRFIINIPEKQRNDLIRVLFAIESAHWFYIDYYHEDGDMNPCGIREFAQQVFQHCPFLRSYVDDIDSILSRWRGYKLSVPTYGAILLDPTKEHILLVQGFYARESWGFPKGKVQENELPLKCAVREVMEEVGFDMKDRAFEDQYLEHDVKGQITRLYLVKDVPMNTKFVPKTRNEIKEARWFPIACLPSHRCDNVSQTKLNISPKAFFMVIPFIKELRRWIDHKQDVHSSCNAESNNAIENLPSHHICQQANNRARTHPNNMHKRKNKKAQVNIEQQTSARTLASSTMMQKQQKPTSQIIANLTPERINKEQESSSDVIQVIPPMLNDNDSRHSSSGQGMKSSCLTTATSSGISLKLHQRNYLTPEMQTPDLTNSGKSKFDKHLPNCSKQHLNSTKVNKPLANITNDGFCFNGPRCWIKFRLNRSEIFDCFRD